MKIPTMIIAVALLALPLAGCIENMRDLKDRMSGAEQEMLEPNALEQETNETRTNATDNVTETFKEPIARVSIYADGGALLFKSTFVAEDVVAPTRVNQGEAVTLNGVDSETQENGAEIATYTWTLGDETFDGRNVVLTPEIAGLHPLVLEVVDSNGMKDTQSVMLAIAPAPFDVTINLVTSAPIVGALGTGERGTASFTVDEKVDGLTVKAVATTVTATPPAECDAGVDLYDSEGERLGRQDSAGHGGDQTETLTVGELEPGPYMVAVFGYACATVTGVPVTVTITYVPVIEGLEGNDGHAHAH